MGKNKTVVSVIVPVYGVEKFVERCVRSLMEQTLKDGIEYIFVDDATPDNSIGIIEQTVKDYPERVNSVKILRHEKNKGLPAARNTGLEAASGEYIYHCDSDDFLEKDMLELMLKEADKKNADYVWCDWYLTFGNSERNMRQPEAETARQALTLMLSGAMKYNVWNKIVRRKLYTENDIRFPTGYAMGEDMTMIRLASHAERTGYVGKPLYHYIQTNTGAMSHQYTDDKLNVLKHNVELTINYLKKNIDDPYIDKEISWFLLNVKLPFLFTGEKKDLERWKNWFKDADKYIMSNPYQSSRTQILQWCAAHDMTIINRLYYYLVFKVIYGKIFK